MSPRNNLSLYIPRQINEMDNMKIKGTLSDAPTSLTLNLLVESDNDKIALSFETILDESVPVDKAVQVNYKNEYWGEPEFHSNWHIRGDTTFGFKFQFLEGNEVRVYTEGGSLVFAYKLQSNLPIIGINVLKLEGSVATISEYGFRFIEDY